MSSVVVRSPDLRASPEQRDCIARLIARYCSAIDNGEYEVWPTLFTAGGVYRITTRTDHEAGRDSGIWYCNNRAMLEDRVTAIRSVNVYEPHCYRHVMGTTEIVGADGGEFRCETSYHVVRTGMEGDMVVFSAGRYVDRIVLAEPQALLSSRIVVADSARFDTLVALPI
jgi:anthranilate 1,2-dioxygenase small subunit